MRLLLLLPLLSIAPALAHPGADAHLDATAHSPCNQPETSVRRAQALLEEGRLDAADAELVRAAQCGIPLRQLRLPQAEISLRRGDPQTALPLLEATVEEEPHDMGALLLRAQAYAGVGRTDEAVLDALDVARRAPTPAPWLMAARYANGNARRQVEILEEANRALGPLPILVRTTAQAQYDAGQLNKALATLDAAGPSADNLALAGDWLALTKPERASKTYEQALALAKAGRATPHQRALIQHIESALETLL